MLDKTRRRQLIEKMRSYLGRSVKNFFGAWLLVAAFSLCIFGQNGETPLNVPVRPSSTQPAPPLITQINEVGLKKLLKPAGKPLLINFWATWCDPCREEFPDLVKLDAEYRGKIDFITISLDDLEEINRAVPKFLADMKADMPAYLLKAVDDSAAIAAVSKNWQGGLPFTILISPKGEAVYSRQGKVNLEHVRTQIDAVIVARPNAAKDR